MKNLEPKICMQRDFKAADFVLNRVKLAEPVAVIGLPQAGKTVIFDYLAENLASFESYEVYDFTITHKQDSEEVMQFVTSFDKKLILLLSISIEADISSFIEQLENIRKKRSVSFIPVVLAYLPSVKAAFENKSPLLNRSCFMLNGVSEADALILLNDFEKRFKLGLNASDFTEIISLSQGSAGILKSLYFYRSAHINVNLNSEILIQDPSISTRIKPIIESFDSKLIKNWLHSNLEFDERILLEQFGFNPLEMPILFKKYVQLYILLPISISPTSLTKLEKKVFDYLHFHLNNVVEKGEIAKVMWGKEWKEKYSDEAIDQLMSRMRRKLQTEASFVVKTHKGIGYSLNS